MRRLALALLVAACSDPSPSPSPPIVPEPAPPPAPPTAPALPVCADVGSLTAELVPDAARAAHEAAVALLGAGRVEAAEEALAAVVADAPAYRMARYNHACALSRLGRADEAWAELLPLLCEELPTFAPRLRADEDLAAVRLRPDVESTLTAIAANYRAAAEGGVPLVAYTHGPPRTDGPGTEWEESQPGSYHHATSRFVPMGPRLRERGAPGASGFGGYALNATRWDAGSGRVLTLLVRGTDAEDPSLGMVALRIVEAPTGRELLAHRWSVGGPDVSARLTPDGAVAWYSDSELETRGLTIDASGARPSPADAGAPALSVGTLSWDFVGRPRIVPERGRASMEGRAIDVGPTPPHWDRYVQPTGDPDRVLVVTYRRGGCGQTDHFRIERLIVSTGARNDVLEDDGYAVIEDFGTMLFVQVGDVLQVLPDLGGGAPTTVRSGLGLTAMARDFNPGC